MDNQYEQNIDATLSAIKRRLLDKAEIEGLESITMFGEPGCMIRSSDSMETLKHMLINNPLGDDKLFEQAWKNLADQAVLCLALFYYEEDEDDINRIFEEAGRDTKNSWDLSGFNFPFPMGL